MSGAQGIPTISNRTETLPSAARKPGVCFGCRMAGHWRRECGNTQEKISCLSFSPELIAGGVKLEKQSESCKQEKVARGNVLSTPNSFSSRETTFRQNVHEWENIGASTGQLNGHTSKRDCELF